MPLDLDLLRARLPRRQIVWRDRVGSTMTEASGLAARGCASGTLVAAEEQTAGQGRHGRPWHSERGAGLYVSQVLRFALRPDDLPAVTLALGLAAAEAIARISGLACDLRWPNDVLIGEKKCAGILVTQSAEALITGIGINVNQTAFPVELADLATSLRLAAGRTHSREELLVALVESSERHLQLLAENGRQPLLEMFHGASSYARGKRVVVEQGGASLRGVTDGLDASGFLVVRLEDGGRSTVRSGGVRPA